MNVDDVLAQLRRCGWKVVLKDGRPVLSPATEVVPDPPAEDLMAALKAVRGEILRRLTPRGSRQAPDEWRWESKRLWEAMDEDYAIRSKNLVYTPDPEPETRRAKRARKAGPRFDSFQGLDERPVPGAQRL